MEVEKMVKLQAYRECLKCRVVGCNDLGIKPKTDECFKRLQEEINKLEDELVDYQIQCEAYATERDLI